MRRFMMRQRDGLARDWLTCGVVALGLMVPAFAAIPDASACQIVACSGERGEINEYVPSDGATVPANLNGLFWAEEANPYGEFSEPERVFYESGAPDEPIELSQHVEEPRALGRPAEVRFESPLLPGREYRLSVPHSCEIESDAAKVEHVYQTTEAAEIPESLGVLEASESYTSDIAGECGFELRAAQSTIKLSLSEEAKPWQDAMWFVPYVNGERWHNTA